MLPYIGQMLMLVLRLYFLPLRYELRIFLSKNRYYVKGRKNGMLPASPGSKNIEDFLGVSQNCPRKGKMQNRNFAKN